jgi:DNA mismatch repair protein MutS
MSDINSDTEKSHQETSEKSSLDNRAKSSFAKETPSKDKSKETPLMRQYWEIKNKFPEPILLFRMGDFYEMFFDDAVKAAPVLNIALTSRNKKSEDETPMCGMPHHSVAGPIGKLLAAGFKVAICDQLEDPATAKGIVKRGITRVLSPGMVYDPDSISASENNFVMSFDEQTVSFLDATQGLGFYYDRHSRDISTFINTHNPVEIICIAGQKKEIESLSLGRITISEFSRIEGALPERFRQLPPSSQRLLTYAMDMQGADTLFSFANFSKKSFDAKMELSRRVIRHLEIFKSSQGEDRGSLFYAINRTKTSAGTRCLKEWLQFPLTDAHAISDRHNEIESWLNKPSDLKILRSTLSQMGDVERRLAKISYTNVHVRDFTSLLNSLKIGQAISSLCLRWTNKQTEILNRVVAEIENTLVEDPPLNMKSGGYIKPDFMPELKKLVSLTENSEQLLLDLEAREKNATGISSLKVRYNNVFGFYIEVTHTHKTKVPDHYKRKQTLANAERYITEELHEIETEVLSARQKRLELEEKLFQNLRTSILNAGSDLLIMSRQWSELDAFTSLAWLALEQKYTRPTFVESGLYIENSRHPVIEQEVAQTFVPNNIELKSAECLLLTGPNMAGKSTLMRQVAITAILAQMGSYVPSTNAKLPLFDQIFTRIGASDSLSEGLSTFMVEMTETSEMLNGATDKSLVVLDEVGRGTSTYDGMSLAQSILEFLISTKKSYTLFATHYHELTALTEAWPNIKNGHMAVQDKAGDIRFLYILKSGPANKSYGIKVAALAGLPPVVVKRAQKLLDSHQSRSELLEAHDLPLLGLAYNKMMDQTSIKEDFSLNASALAPSNSIGTSLTIAEQTILQQMKECNISGLTPLEALNKLSEWQQSLS